MKKGVCLFVCLIVIFVALNLSLVDSSTKYFSESQLRSLLKGDVYPNPSCKGANCLNDGQFKYVTRDGGATATAVCKALGYDKYKSIPKVDWDGWSSPNNNGMVRWTGSHLECVCANKDNGAMFNAIVCEKKDCISKTCSSYSRQCGTSLDNGCGSTINCASNCKTNENCVEGVCECSEGFGDCNSDWSDGCEINLSTIDNCGSCGNNCTELYGVGAECVDSECIMPIYNYWTDMNGDDISEVDLKDYVRINSNAEPDYEVIQNGSFLKNISEKYWETDSVNNNFSFISQSGESNNSIDVDDNEDDEEMNIKIINPKCGDAFEYSGNLSVKFEIDDPDDFVTGNVWVNDELLADFDNSESNVVEINYILESPGSIPIVIEANGTRKDKFKTILNVMAYNSSNENDQYYVAACIDKPENFFRTDSTLIEFDGKSSRAIKYNPSSGISEIPKSELIFKWTFWFYGISTPKYCKAYGDKHCISGTSETVINFWRRFPTVNGNKVGLSVAIPDDYIN